MKEDLMLLRTMPWKHKGVLVFLFISGVLMIGIAESSQMMTVERVLLYTVLLIASYFDYRFRIIPDWIHLVVIAIGFINISVAKSLIGLVISPLPFLIVALMSKGSIGGGDIKLIGATGFVMGYAKTSTSYLIAMVLAILFCSLYYLGKKKIKEQSFPFAPFFQIGCAIVIVTGGL